MTEKSEKTKELYKKGRKEIQIGKDVDHSKPRTRKGGTREINRQKLKRLFEEGLTDEEIAEKLACSPNTVRQIRTEEFGLKRVRKRTNVSTKALVMLSRVFEGPVFEKELQEIFNSKSKTIARYHGVLIEYGIPVRKFSLNSEEKIITLYYLEGQEKSAIKTIRKAFPMVFKEKQSEIENFLDG